MAEERIEHVISDEAVDCAAMIWAQATWLYNQVHLNDDDPTLANDTYKTWLQIQLEADDRLGDMPIDEVEKYIHQYEIAYQEHGNVIDTKGLDVGDELYNVATKAWAEIKAYIAHDASLDYAEDTVTFESHAQESLHNYIDKAGGEKEFFDSITKQVK